MRMVQFTFDAGKMLTGHSSPRAVAVQLVSGRMRFTIDGTDHAMGDGDVIYLAPGAPHALVAETAYRMTLVSGPLALIRATVASTDPNR